MKLPAVETTLLVALRPERQPRTLDANAPRPAARRQVADDLRASWNAAARPVLARLDGLGDAVLGAELLAHVGTLVVRTTPGDRAEVIAALRANEHVADVVDDAVEQLDPIDAVSASTEPSRSWAIDAAKVGDVWARGTTGAGVTIGMIDSGFDANHPALRDRYRGRATGTDDHNWMDFAEGTASPTDGAGHGTAAASVAVGSDPTHVTGIAPGASLIGVRAFDSRGMTKREHLLRALDWMCAPTDRVGANPDPTRAPDVLSNSWGTMFGAFTGYQNAMNALEALGVTVLAAAGNQGAGKPDNSDIGWRIGSPGSYANVLGVGATQQDGSIATYSSRGPSPLKDSSGTFIEKPDLAAPGHQIAAALLNGGWGTFAGTSAATPVAAGAVALLLSKHPGLTPARVRELMRASATDAGDPGFDRTFGAGRLDAAKLLELADLDQ